MSLQSKLQIEGANIRFNGRTADPNGLQGVKVGEQHTVCAFRRKSTTAFLAEIGLRQGLSLAQVKSAIAEDGRARNKWRRKRDRRPGYKGRQQEIPEKSLKRTVLEAKAASDIAKSLARVGML